MATALRNINSNKICKALRDESAVSFVKKCLNKNYTRHFPEKKEEVIKLIEFVLSVLVNSQSAGISKKKLEKAVEKAREKFFANKNKNAWFREYYSRYKSDIKPKKELERIRPFIKGKQILDFGSGKSYLFSSLDIDEFQVVCTDVEDFRDFDLTSTCFLKMSSPTKIPLIDDSIDTAVIITVLHHINKEDIHPIAVELARVAKRLIVIEDIDDFDELVFETDKKINFDDLTKTFLQLSKKSRNYANIITDFFGNVIVQGYTDLNLPFMFHSTPSWIKIFENADFKKHKVKILGFSDSHLHDFFKVLIVLEREV
ncbi:MAG: hypothetical protein ABFQ62_01830 [Patescibacteria group bacterium]